MIAVATTVDESQTFTDLFPNPTSESFYFNYTGNNFSEPINVILMNNNGKVVSVTEFIEFNKAQSLNILTIETANGLYQVIISQCDKKEIKRISVIH